MTTTNIDMTKNIKSRYFKKLNKKKLMFRIGEIKRHSIAVAETVKTNRTRSTKWTYYKDRGFAPNCVIFLRI